MPGRLFGVGVGPGDPELITVKAARLIAAADVVAYHAAGHGRSNARAIAAAYLRDDQVEEALIYPVTTGTTDHPGGYQGAIDDFYAESAARLAAHLDAGRDVVVLAEGDPFFAPGERKAPLAEIDPESVPYFSLALVPSPAAAGEKSRGEGGDGAVTVIGLGPGDPLWLTPEARAAIAKADDLIGYGPYLDRVATRPTQRRHPSDNRVETERATFALDLAKRGRRVAVISSGDPGVFAMAAAVLEVSEDPEWKDVPVRVVPGLTAAQAVAARVGAPLGHDFCVLSLSDRLKPWPVIERRLRAAADADLVIAIYNPASKARTDQLVQAREVLLGVRAPETPVVVGRDVGGPAESVRVTTLADLDPAGVDMRCLLLIGSSRTRTIARSDGPPQVYTPRHYPAAG